MTKITHRIFGIKSFFLLSSTIQSPLHWSSDVKRGAVICSQMWKLNYHWRRPLMRKHYLSHMELFWWNLIYLKQSILQACCEPPLPSQLPAPHTCHFSLFSSSVSQEVRERRGASQGFHRKGNRSKRITKFKWISIRLSHINTQEKEQPLCFSLVCFLPSSLYPSLYLSFCLSLFCLSFSWPSLLFATWLLIHPIYFTEFSSLVSICIERLKRSLDWVLAIWGGAKWEQRFPSPHLGEGCIEPSGEDLGESKLLGRKTFKGTWSTTGRTGKQQPGVKMMEKYG